MSKKRKSPVDNLVKIYVRPETAYHLNQMLAQSPSLKYPGQVVDKILRTIMTEREAAKEGGRYGRSH